MDEVKGVIFDIQRFSVHDGPGIRTSVFMKGCPLSCIWCHNPEAIEAAPEIAYYGDKCSGCGCCAAVCPNNCHGTACDNERKFSRENCIRCGKCAEACVYQAVTVTGKTVTAAEVIETVKKDELFYQNSGGGMTLTGGEPFFQPVFALELLKLAKQNGLHTCVETCGAVSFEILNEAACCTHIFLYDVKETCADKHFEFTGAGNGIILENLFKLDALNVEIILRCPIIPELNDNEDHFINIGKLADQTKNAKEIHIQPYHPLGISKSKAIGKQPRYPNSQITSKETTVAWAAEIQKHTVKPVLLLQ